MIDRRQWLTMSLAAVVTPRALFAQSASLIRRAIPSTGERIPVIGLGTSATFAQSARSGETAGLTEVLKTMADKGGTVIDTAPAYGAAEETAGAIAGELGIGDKVFWATKVNVAGRGDGAKADPAAARAQIETSFTRLKRSKIDLIQVHNLADLPTHLGILKELKAEKRVRYIGVTTTSNNQYTQLQDVMKNEPLDFIGVDYAVDNRDVEEAILPLAAERKIAVMVYLPFGRTRLFKRVEGREVPEWAKEFGAASWAQFFLKYVVAHPAVTVVTPATTKAAHIIDNIGGGIGKLPSAADRKRMVEFIDALPAAAS